MKVYKRFGKCPKFIQNPTLKVHLDLHEKNIDVH